MGNRKKSRRVSSALRADAGQMHLFGISETADFSIQNGHDLRLDSSYVPLVTQKRSVLPCGLTLLSEYAPPESLTHGFQPIGKIYVWNAGFFAEPSTPHALEHMLVERSTKERQGETYIKIADKHGSLSNAEVFSRFTEYYCNPPRGFVIQLLKPLLEQTIDALVLAEEFQIELGPIKDEVRIWQSDGETYPSLLARGNLFGVEPFLLYETGPISCIEKLTINDLLEFRRKYYYPENMTLHVVDSVPYPGGSVEYRAAKFHQDVMKVVNKFFDERAFRRPEAEAVSQIYYPTVKISSNVSDNDYVDMADSFYAKARKDAHTESPHRDLTIELIKDLLDRRAWNQLRMRMGTGYHVDYEYTEAPENALVFNATCGPNDFDRMRHAMMKIEDNILSSGFTNDELETQRTRMSHKIDDKYGNGSSIIQFEKDARFKESLSYSGQKSYLKTITLDEVNHVVRQILNQPSSEAYMGRRL